MSTTKQVTAIKSNPERGIIAGSMYRVVDETTSFYFLDGVGKVAKSNFISEGIIEPPVPKTVQGKSSQFAKCNVRNAYKNLTVGKEYEVTKVEKDGATEYFYIINDAGASSRYNKKFFTSLQTRGAANTAAAVEEKPKAPVVPKGYALCNNGGVLGIETGKQYQVVKDNVNTIEIKLEATGKTGLFLKSRFTIGK